MVAERLFNLLFWLAVAIAIVFASMPSPMPLPGSPSDKLLHTLAFFALALLAIFAFPRVRIGILFLGLCALGGAIEIIQGTPYVGRETSWLDWLADLGGAGFVLVIAGITRALARPPTAPSDARNRRR
jgi:VanZ family protein